MSFKLRECFDRGGPDLLRLLDYCIRAMELSPVFLFLVEEYRRAPSSAKAIALFRAFCQPNAPARIDVPTVLPPANLSLQESLRPLLAAAAATQSGPLPSPMHLPPKYLFDFIAETVARESRSVRRVSRRYKPSRSPVENLPGGKMTAGQRYFVERVWQPSVRPLLVSAGFWRVATVA